MPPKPLRKLAPASDGLGMISVDIETGAGLIQKRLIPADIIAPGLAIHPAVSEDDDGYTVTHVSTGRKFGPGFTTPEIAREVAIKLARLTNWERVKSEASITPGLRKLALGILKAARCRS